MGPFALDHRQHAAAHHELTAKGGEAKIVSLDVHELKSVWLVKK